MIGINLVLEGVLSAWYFKEAFITQDISIYAMLLTWVLYFSAKIVLYIRWNKKGHGALAALIVLAVGVASVWVFAPIAYFFMLCVLQALYFAKRNGYYASILAFGLALFISDIYVEAFVVAATFTLLVITISRLYEKRIYKLEKFVEKYRVKTERLQENALALKEYDVSARYASQLEQRNSIAQKLHDELGHTLSGSTLQLEAILLIMQKDPTEAKAMLATVISGLRGGTDEIRQILKNIKPEASSLNIGNIKLLASNAQERAGIKTDVLYDTHIADITRKQWQVITANVREAMTNMMKHAKATKAQIVFEKLNKLFKITVKDNGIGCVNIESGLGIAGMDERCADIGGTLVVDGNHGFSVIMLLPIDENRG